MKTTYHCPREPYAGRTFTSKDDFLRQLRGGKSEQLAPKGNNQPASRKETTRRLDDAPAVASVSGFSTMGRVRVDLL
jgi:hypothetical protein